MRKQYHFQPNGDAFDAWDVDRLIDLSKDFPVVEVDPTSFPQVDTVYWFDPERPGMTVRELVAHARLISKVDLSYPIILGADGRIMDGMHRVCRALLDEGPVIPAVQFEADPEPDYRNCMPGDLPYD